MFGSYGDDVLSGELGNDWVAVATLVGGSADSVQELFDNSNILI